MKAKGKPAFQPLPSILPAFRLRLFSLPASFLEFLPSCPSAFLPSGLRFHLARLARGGAVLDL